MKTPPLHRCPRCVICGSTKQLELNHVGGRNHVAWFTLWFCQAHHRKYHAQLAQLDVELTYIADPMKRYNRVLKAIAFCALIVADAQHEVLSARKVRQSKRVRQD